MPSKRDNSSRDPKFDLSIKDTGLMIGRPSAALRLSRTQYANLLYSLHQCITGKNLPSWLQDN